MDAYRAFLDGLDENARGNHAEGIAQWMRAADLDSTYMQPLLHAAAMLSGAAPATADSLVRRVARRRVSLTPGDRAWLEAIRANIDGNTQRFFDASYDIIRAEPGAMLPYFFVGIGGVRLNRPNAALEAATHVNYKSGRFKLQWAGEVFSFVVAEANHQLGRYTRELEWTREVRDLHPDNRNPVAWTLRALAALGDTNAMDSVLTKLEAMPPTSYGPPLATHFLTIAGELGFHGHPVEAERFLRHAAEWQRNHATEVVPPGNARFEFARTLFFLAQFEEARSLLDSLLRADPANPLYLAYGAVSAARTGDSVTASVLRARLDTLRRPFDHGFTPYAKALVAAQMGHTAAALTYLEASSGQGMPPDLMSIHADLMLAPLWPNERYRALLRPKD
jgi:tetratricopeptide (TPR) repeat protein